MQTAAKVDVLSPDEMWKIKQTMLRMLHEMGILIECPEAAAMMQRHGYRMAGQRLKPTPDETLAFINNYAHSPARKPARRRDELVPFPKKFGLGVCDVNILDWDTKQKRRGTLEDTRQAALLANELEYIGGLHVVVLPAEIHPELAEIAAIVEASKYTPKVSGIGGGQQLTPRNLQYREELGQLIAGGPQAYQGLGLAGFDMSSPMKLSKFCTDRTRLTMKYKRLGGSSTTLPLQGLTGMVTLAGCIAQSLAETLGGGMFLEMIEKEMTGAAHYAFRMSPSFVPADMRTMREACSAVENTLAHIAIDQMLECLGLPLMKYNYGGGKTESKLWDAQCGFEKMLNTVFPLLGGIGWGPYFLGEMCTNEYFSFEQVLIDYEMSAMGNRILEGIRVDDTALDFEVFKAGVAAGLFTALEHTGEYYRSELYLPNLTSRESYTQWDNNGRKLLEEKAHAQIVEILKKAQPQPKYPPELLKEMDKMLERFKKDF